MLALNLHCAYAQNINYSGISFYRATGCSSSGNATHYIICSDLPTNMQFENYNGTITSSFFKSSAGCDTIEIDSIIANFCLHQTILNDSFYTQIKSDKNIVVYEGQIFNQKNNAYPSHRFCRLIPPPSLAGTANINLSYAMSYYSSLNNTNYIEYGNSLILLGINDSSTINIFPKWPHPLLNGNFYYSIPLQNKRGYFEYFWNTNLSPNFPFYYPQCLVTQDSSTISSGKFITQTGMQGYGTGIASLPWSLSQGFRFYPLAYEFLGKNYHTIPHLTREGDSLLAIAFHDSTVINLNGISNVINRGDVFRVLLDTPGVWQANHPFSLVQISRHQQEDSVLYSSLFAYSVHPDSALLKSTWYTTEIVPDSTPGEQSYLNLIAPSNGVATVKLDGNSLSSYFIPYPGDSIWSYAQIPVTSVQHKLEADSGVIAYAYQYSLGCGVGFYVGGLEMKNTLTGISSSPKNSPLRAYPNPAHTLLYIEHGEHISGNKFNRVNIYSADGRSVLRTSVKNSSRIELDVELLENGLYFIELSSEFESFTTKFVKN